MAKIYETKADFERERLSKEALDARNSQDHLLTTGFGTTFLGSTWISMGGLENKVKALTVDIEKDFLSHNAGRINYIFGAILAALGITGVVASFFFRSKAKKAEDALAKLGPEQVVLPPGVGCDECSQTKVHTQSIAPKTLLEQATKSADSTLSKA